MTHTTTDAAPTTTKPHPLTRAELARRAGRAKSAVTKALAGPLSAACLPDKRVDVAHPAVVAWARRCGVNPEILLSPLKSRRHDVKVTGESRAVGRTVESQSVLELDEMLDLTVRELTDRYGSVTALSDVIDLRKVAADTRRIELQNEQTKGRLISRELVETHVFGALEALNLGLLRDMPKTLARRLAAMVRAGGTVSECEGVVRDLIGSQMKTTKTSVLRALRNQETAS